MTQIPRRKAGDLFTVVMQVYKEKVQGQQRQQAYNQQTQQITHFYTFLAASADRIPQSRERRKSGL